MLHDVLYNRVQALLGGNEVALEALAHLQEYDSERLERTSALEKVKLGVELKKSQQVVHRALLLKGLESIERDIDALPEATTLAGKKVRFVVPDEGPALPIHDACAKGKGGAILGGDSLHIQDVTDLFNEAVNDTLKIHGMYRDPRFIA